MLDVVLCLGSPRPESVDVISVSQSGINELQVFAYSVQLCDSRSLSTTSRPGPSGHGIKQIS